MNKKINKECLIDINEISVDLKNDNKMEDFINSVKDPYRFMCGKVKVNVRFDEKGPEFQDLVRNFFIMLKKEKY